MSFADEWPRTGRPLHGCVRDGRQALVTHHDDDLGSRGGEVSMLCTSANGAAAMHL